MMDALIAGLPSRKPLQGQHSDFSGDGADSDGDRDLEQLVAVVAVECSCDLRPGAAALDAVP
jgi:hypothetical protein